MIEPKMESYKKCATDLAKISKQTLISYPNARYYQNTSIVKLSGMTFDAFISFDKDNKVESVEFHTITGSCIKVNNLQSDNSEVVDYRKEIKGLNKINPFIFYIFFDLDMKYYW